jgi:hypothetical protein
MEVKIFQVEPELTSWGQSCQKSVQFGVISCPILNVKAISMILFNCWQIMLTKAQTPLVWFAVDLLYNKLYDLS